MIYVYVDRMLVTLRLRHNMHMLLVGPSCGMYNYVFQQPCNLISPNAGHDGPAVAHQ